MLNRIEFHAALSLAIAAAQPPLENEAPLDGINKPELAHVCFDFWPGNTMRIVGTNGRRLVVVFCDVAGPNGGKFLIPLTQAVEAAALFAPGLQDFTGAPRTVDIALFGLEQMILTSGEDALMSEGSKALYPEYHTMLQGDTLPTKGAIFDVGTLAWVLNQAATVGERALSVQLRALGPTTFQPQLRAEFTAVRKVLFAIKPLGLSS